MKRLISCALLTTALSACATTAPAPLAPVTPVADIAPVTVPVEPAPAAAIGSFGFDLTGMERTVAPGANFYDFANGAWQKRTEIPADKSNYGTFNVLQDESQKRVREILDAAAQDPTSRIGMVYSSFLDEAAVEARGLAPVKPILDDIRSVASKRDYAALAARARGLGISGLVGDGIGQDDRKSDTYIYGVYQDGLGMPDRDMYLLGDARFVELRAAYLTHIENLLTLAGEGNARARAKAILDLETAIAKVSWTREDSGDITKTYNKMSPGELAAKAPGFDWATYFQGRGIGNGALIVSEPSAIAGIAAIAGRTPLGVLRDQYLVRALDAYANVLPKAVYDEYFAFNEKALNGTPEQQPRWKRAVDFTVDTLTDDVSQIYVAKYFPPESKAKMNALVDNVVAAMGRRIEQLDWMEPQTKVKAKAKLAAFTSRVGYPDQWHDYSSIAVSRDDLFGNAVRRAEWGNAWSVNKLGKPIYKWEWGIDPMTVNATANFNRRDHLPGGHPPAALLRPQRRPCDQLWRNRRGHRSRDEPPVRRPGREIRSER